MKISFGGFRMGRPSIINEQINRQRYVIKKHLMFKNQQRLQTFKKLNGWFNLFLVIAYIPLIISATVALIYPLIWLVIVTITLGLILLTTGTDLASFLSGDIFSLAIKVAAISLVVVIALSIIKALAIKKLAKDELKELNLEPATAGNDKYIALHSVIKKLNKNSIYSLISLIGLALIVLAIFIPTDGGNVSTAQVALVIAGILVLIVSSIIRSIRIRKMYYEAKPYIDEISQERRTIKAEQKKAKKALKEINSNPTPTFGLASTDSNETTKEKIE